MYINKKYLLDLIKHQQREIEKLKIQVNGHTEEQYQRGLIGRIDDKENPVTHFFTGFADTGNRITKVPSLDARINKLQGILNELVDFVYSEKK